MADMIYVAGEELGWGGKGKARRDARQDDRKERKMERQGNKPQLLETKANFTQIKIFPLGSDVIAGAGDPVLLSQNAQNAFQPIRGIIQASVSLDTVILSEIKVGNVSQLVVGANFPAQMFSPAADDVLCDLDVVPPGIQFRLEGVSGIQTVTAGFFGHYFSSVNLRGAR